MIGTFLVGLLAWGIVFDCHTTDRLEKWVWHWVTKATQHRIAAEAVESFDHADVERDWLRDVCLCNWTSYRVAKGWQVYADAQLELAYAERPWLKG